jgi:hypothetical protein
MYFEIWTDMLTASRPPVSTRRLNKRSWRLITRGDPSLLLRILRTGRATMRNRRTDLIEWNDELSDGMGRSGTRYKLSYDHTAGGNTGGHWLIDIDGVTVCSATSAQDAFARSEGLEALRCILQGRSEWISDEHCRVAEVIANEMLEAATEALSHSMHFEARGDLLRNVDALQALSSAIRLECLDRQRESKRDAPPPLN